MNELWIVVVEDHHTDADALPYSTEQAAVARARAMAARYAWHPETIEDVALNKAMLNDGWVLCLSYGTEGDRVRVIRREVN